MPICGYDPMNMVKMGDGILCSHFIMLAAAGSADPMFIKGPVMLDVQAGSRVAVSAYWT